MDLELEMEVTGGFSLVLTVLISVNLGALTRLPLLGAGTHLPCIGFHMDFSLPQGNHKYVDKTFDSHI